MSLFADSRSMVLKGGQTKVRFLPPKLRIKGSCKLAIKQKPCRHFLHPLFCTPKSQILSQNNNDDQREQEQQQSNENSSSTYYSLKPTNEKTINAESSTNTEESSMKNSGKIENDDSNQNSEEKTKSLWENFAIFGGVLFAFNYIKNMPRRWQHIRTLRKTSDENPQDAEKHAKFLKALNKSQNPSEVITRVESGNYATSSTVIIEYMKALVLTNRINEYSGEENFSVESEHRSLTRLLGDLKKQAEGDTSFEQPGHTARNPLYIQIQKDGVVPQSTPKNPVQMIVGFLKFATTALITIAFFSFLWGVGMMALRKVDRQAIDAANGGAGPITQSSQYAPKEYNKENIPEKSVKTFKDVKGCDEAKEELQEIVEYLKNPDKFTKLGAKLPKGVLLTGPPGTGKTLLARAVAGEADVPFFYRAGSEFEEMFVGVGSRRVRALFQAAKKKAPCIIFVDEVDAVGEMDGFEENSGVVVMAATNMPETLDPALTRPGRFDRNVAVPLPDVNGRAEIVQYYLDSKPVAADVTALDIARKTPGFSGAQLFNLINEAALSAAKQSLTLIDTSLLDEARDKILMGKERKNLAQSLEFRRLTAFHEAGHALVALGTPGAHPIHKATIIPRGHALGMVSQVPSDDEFSISQQQCIAKMDVCMGGLVAEELVFGKDQRTTGAQSDLKKATEIARHMVSHCGMVDAIGPIYIEDDEVSPDLKKVVDDEVSRLLKESQLRVKDMLSKKIKDLQRIANALLEYETLTADDIQKVLTDSFQPPVKLQPVSNQEKINGVTDLKQQPPGRTTLTEPVLD